jgi:hypothetical protein
VQCGAWQDFVPEYIYSGEKSWHAPHCTAPHCTAMLCDASDTETSTWARTCKVWGPVLQAGYVERGHR